jgi:hypothetical protein
VDTRAERTLPGASSGDIASMPNALAIEVSAQACPLPMPEQILLRTMLAADGSIEMSGETRGE